METRILTPGGSELEGLPEKTRVASPEDIKNFTGGFQRRTLQPPPGIMLQEVPHPVSKAPSWAAIILPSEYRSHGWVFFDAAIIEGDIRFGRSERALLIKRLGSLLGTFILHRQAWVFGTDKLGAGKGLDDELAKMKNAFVMEIITNAGYGPKEYKSAVKSLAAAGDKAFHNMSFWDNQIASKGKRKKWEIGVNIEQAGEHLSDDGKVLHRTEEVI